MEEIPITSIQLTESDDNTQSTAQISAKRAKTEGSDIISHRSQPQIKISLNESGRKNGERKVSDSLKKLRMKQPAQTPERKASSSQLY